jgi:hypothetical protein
MQIVEDYEGSTLVQWNIVLGYGDVSLTETYLGLSDFNCIGSYTQTFHIMVF